MRSIIAALSLIPLLPTAAAAQDKSAAPVASDALPDPATITVPDVTPPTDPKVRGDGYKFYYFHNPNVTFAQAYDDIAECRAFLAHTVAGPVPGFIPWSVGVTRSTARVTDKSPTVGASPYGILGDAMGAIMMPKMERGSRSNILRRCMGTRGYVRYAITESAFDQLNDGDEDKLILMQAKLASGPKPNDEEVTR